MKRLLLYVSVPALIIIGVITVFLHGGRLVSTDNAYVKTGIVTGAARSSGEIVGVFVKRNQHIKAGELIAQLDDTEAKTKLLEAKAGLATARHIVAAIKVNYRKSVAAVNKAKEKLAYETLELHRAQELVQNHTVSESTLDEHRHLVEEAKHDIDVLQQAADMALTQLDGDPDLPADRHPMVMKALAAMETAKVMLEHRQVRALTAGTITHIDLHPGEFVTVGAPIFGMTVDGDLRVEANLKETELTYVREGQKVDVFVDALPGQVFKATVTSIDPATGSEFAVLPAQNATGNWVKVTQRVPVQIRFTKGQDVSRLRSGLSVEVEIDTHHKRTVKDLEELLRFK